MKNTKISYTVILFLFFFVVQALISSYFTSISNVELLLLFIFIFLILNLFVFLLAVIKKALADYNLELKVFIKKEIYFTLIYLQKIQIFFKNNLNQYFLLFNLSKRALNLYKKQIVLSYKSLYFLINYLYLNFLVAIFLEYLNVKSCLINNIKRFNFNYISIFNKIKATNFSNNISNKQ